MLTRDFRMLNFTIFTEYNAYGQSIAFKKKKKTITTSSHKCTSIPQFSGRKKITNFKHGPFCPMTKHETIWLHETILAT